jgi:hypothetical protein
LWLFSVKPAEYLVNDAFRVKLVVLAVAMANVMLFQSLTKQNVTGSVARIGAAVSLCLWLSVLIAGRWIGFV